MAGELLLNCWQEQVEQFKEFTAPLLAMIPVAKMEFALGQNQELHDEMKAQRADIIVVDPKSKAGMSTMMVWVVSLSAAPLKIKKAAPMVSMQTVQQIDLTMQAKSGVMAPELYQALKESPEKECQSMLESMLGHVINIDQMPTIYKAYELRPVERDGKIHLPGMIQAGFEVPLSLAQDILSCSGMH